MEHTHKVDITYRKYTGARREQTLYCNSLEEAQKVCAETCKRLEDEGYERVRGFIFDIRPVEQKPVLAEPTHYRVTIKNGEGLRKAYLIPIDYDLDKAIDSFDDDMKVIGIEKVIRNIAAAPQRMRINSRFESKNNV